MGCIPSTTRIVSEQLASVQTDSIVPERRPPVQITPTKELRAQQAESARRLQRTTSFDFDEEYVESRALREQLEAYIKTSTELTVELNGWAHYIAGSSKAVVCVHVISHVNDAALVFKRAYDALLAARDWYRVPLHGDLQKHLPVMDKTSKHPVDVLALFTRQSAA